MEQCIFACRNCVAAGEGWRVRSPVNATRNAPGKVSRTLVCGLESMTSAAEPYRERLKVCMSWILDKRLTVMSKSEQKRRKVARVMVAAWGLAAAPLAAAAEAAAAAAVPALEAKDAAAAKVAGEAWAPPLVAAGAAAQSLWGGCGGCGPGWGANRRRVRLPIPVIEQAEAVFELVGSRILMHGIKPPHVYWSHARSVTLIAHLVVHFPAGYLPFRRLSSLRYTPSRPESCPLDHSACPPTLPSSVCILYGVYPVGHNPVPLPKASFRLPCHPLPPCRWPCRHRCRPLRQHLPLPQLLSAAPCMRPTTPANGIALWRHIQVGASRSCASCRGVWRSVHGLCATKQAYDACAAWLLPNSA